MSTATPTANATPTLVLEIDIRMRRQATASVPVRRRSSSDNARIPAATEINQAIWNGCMMSFQPGPRNSSNVETNSAQKSPTR